jgi:hypothetical protein
LRARLDIGRIRRGTVGFIDDISEAFVFVTWGRRPSRDSFSHPDVRRYFEALAALPCGVPWGVCPRCIGEGLQLVSGIAICPWCRHRWDAKSVVPWPWPGEVLAGPLCGGPWGTCPVCVGKSLQLASGVAMCPRCRHRWNARAVVPCPWPGEEIIAGGGVFVCRSHVRHHERAVTMPE